MPILYVDAAVLNDKGRIRENNEDNYYLNGLSLTPENRNNSSLVQASFKDGVQFFAVCDGMGGEDFGEEASLCAVNAISKFHARGSTPSAANLNELLQSASNRIHLSAKSEGKNSGTTIAMLIVYRHYIRYLHIGDSRVYCLKNGRFQCLTVDHTQVRRMISMGLLTEEEAVNHHRRHVITQYIGMPPEEGDLSIPLSRPESAAKGDIYLLCSDGLTDMVPDEKIERILRKGDMPGDIVKALVDEAIKAGGKDNVTAMCVKVKDIKKELGFRIKAVRKFALIAMNLIVILSMLMTLADLIFFLAHP